ncbi:GtrA family protein [Micromonospora sp. NPDC049679]|uniref:GtrA family protein n=1 Tax=Micromonospora sp. NPDC049679 TaxID=3155920 RepID=UPI0033F61B95
MTPPAEQTATARDGAPAGRSGLPGTLRRIVRIGFVRFLVVGGVSAGIDAGLLWLLHGVAGVQLEVATLIAVVSAFVVNFLLNRGWVFGATGTPHGQFARYLTLAALNWILTVVSVSGLVALGVHYLVARMAVLAVLTVVNFLAYRSWVFPAAPRR